MPYDEGLAQRIREVVDDDPRISEKRMFGGVAFMANGNMAVGIIRDELMVRVGPEAYDAAIALPHARPMDFTGRPMRGFVQVAPAGFEDDADLRAWIARGVAFAVTQQKKPTRAKAAKKGGKPAAKRAQRAKAKPGRKR
ncbi:MAG: TfoX/Sxy family protein [Deltaproteobacteria bacterium]|nr:TfoX/Sxy family protein [Deltaproteobacteria bacterium]